MKLLNGTIISKDKGGDYPPLQNIIQIKHACEICPIRKLCNDNNEFDCQVYSMFSGFYCTPEDAYEYLSKKR